MAIPNEAEADDAFVPQHVEVSRPNMDSLLGSLDELEADYARTIAAERVGMAAVDVGDNSALDGEDNDEFLDELEADSANAPEGYVALLESDSEEDGFALPVPDNADSEDEAPQYEEEVVNEAPAEQHPTWPPAPATAANSDDCNAGNSGWVADFSVGMPPPPLPTPPTLETMVITEEKKRLIREAMEQVKPVVPPRFADVSDEALQIMVEDLLRKDRAAAGISQ